jgi:hypothetical protein
MKKKEAEMITPKQYAEQHGVHYTTVMGWLRRELVKGAVKEELPYGGWYYRVPFNAPLPDLKPGRPAKSAEADDDQSTESEAETAPAEKATKTPAGKKAGTKKAAKK